MEGIENGEISSSAQERVMELLKRSFRPEFLNRLDEIVTFKPLSEEEIDKIVEILLERLKKRLKAEGLTLIVTDRAKAHISDGGYDPVYGARPLKRFIQSHIETPIARYIVSGATKEGSEITLDYDGEQIIIK